MPCNQVPCKCEVFDVQSALNKRATHGSLRVMANAESNKMHIVLRLIHSAF